MSQHLDEERSPASVWWDNFANFAWRTDWTQVVIILFLSTLGVVAIHSAGSARESVFYRSQIVFVGIGWAAYWAVSSLDYRLIQRHARHLFLASVLLLLPVSLCALAKNRPRHLHPQHQRGAALDGFRSVLDPAIGVREGRRPDLPGGDAGAFSDRRLPRHLAHRPPVPGGGAGPVCLDFCAAGPRFCAHHTCRCHFFCSSPPA